MQIFPLISFITWLFFLFSEIVIFMNNIGNKTSCRPIHSVTILVKKKSILLSFVWLQTELDDTKSKSDWLSTALISPLIGQYASFLNNWTACTIPTAHWKAFFYWPLAKALRICCVLILKTLQYRTYWYSYDEVVTNVCVDQFGL